MYKDVYGDMHFEPIDVAHKIVISSISSPFYIIREEYVNGLNTHIHIYDNKDKRISLSMRPGLYAIYTIDERECLYVGQTGYSIHQRIYRFDKETKGKSRHDETHPAATKARQDGIECLDGMKIKFMDTYDIIQSVIKLDPNYEHAFGDVELDVYVAKILKSKYNTIVKE